MGTIVSGVLEMGPSSSAPADQWHKGKGTLSWQERTLQGDVALVHFLLTARRELGPS